MSLQPNAGGTQEPTYASVTAEQQQSMGAAVETMSADAASDATTPVMQRDIVVPQGFDPSKVITRKFLASHSNTLSRMHAHPEEAMCKMMVNDVWQSKTRYAPDCTPSAHRQGDVSRVMLLGVKVKKVHSTFPCELGVSLTGVKGNVYTSTGDRFAYTVAPNEARYDADEVIMATDTAASSEFMRMYPTTTQANLRTNGIMTVPGEDFVYVSKDHPLVPLVQANAEQLQVDLQSAPLMDGRFYKMATPLVERCLDEIDTNVLSKLPVVNLNNFGVKIQRLHGLPWNAKTEVCDGILDRSTQKMMMNDINRRLGLTLEVSYVFV